MILSIALLLFAQVDAEDAKRIAGDLVTKGNDLFEQKKYQEALSAFEEAYETFPSPKIHYNLARTLAAVDRPLEAIVHYERFLADAGLEESDARFKKAQEELARLEDVVGRVAFVTDAVGSTLSLDGQPPQPLPESTLRLLPGPHRVEIETPDGRRFVETVDVSAGETIRVHVLFPTIASPPPGPRAIVEPPPPSSEESEPLVSKWWFWTAIGAAVVAVGVGVGVGVASRSSGPFIREGELDVSSTAEWERR